ncbi:hypothetical protein CC85DRAFT_300316 [Cutaneotrichosporon oleaginosum]|uniref:RRM domain-containing protein n=1 Tax=Cutaneotrichosporon oleaginosum TaxID=879819 RepID=A0A0J0XUL5_9TREE|nr:uncharacterized protein CC85DRAFT_300316 [Cutaneotrichosporon oleaginosum]KLT44773.1 hypothetical protein CC85DRAFT_300316 [Cutaneotrichosporon oleaginosum]TXT07758.1 hypothetical protein COLE_04682 [Cutaneotrichosporon oleaginosum]
MPPFNLGRPQINNFPNGQSPPQNDGVWHRANAGRPCLDICVPSYNNLNDHTSPTEFEPAPWSQHRAFSRGFPLPSPPWETVPLRRNNGRGFKNNNGNTSKSQWFKVDGGLITNDGQVVQHVRDKARQETHQDPSSTSGFIDRCNLIVRGLDSDINSAYLVHVFELFGPIKSTRVMRDAAGRSRGFGFVNFTCIEDANNAQRTMDGTKLGDKWIKVSHHRPLNPRREQGTGLSPAAQASNLTRENTGASATGESKPLKLAVTTNKSIVPAIAETADAGPSTLTTKVESKQAHVKVGPTKSSSKPDKGKNTKATTSNKIEEVSDLLASVNLGELTFERLSGMAPSRVLQILTSDDGALIHRLDLAKCEPQLLPSFWGDKNPQRLDVIRYVNKVAPPRYHGKKRSDITMSIRAFVNSLSETEEWDFVKLLPYHKLIIAMALKD